MPTKRCTSIVMLRRLEGLSDGGIDEKVMKQNEKARALHSIRTLRLALITCLQESDRLQLSASTRQRNGLVLFKEQNHNTYHSTSGRVMEVTTSSSRRSTSLKLTRIIATFTYSNALTDRVLTSLPKKERCQRGGDPQYVPQTLFTGRKVVTADQTARLSYHCTTTLKPIRFSGLTYCMLKYTSFARHI